MDVLLLAVAVLYLFYTPFTKVEESFNLQAIHDILYLKNNISQYDHHEFPGVVPRTFLGPLCIGVLSSPFVLLSQSLNLEKFWTQYVVRFTLAALVCLSWSRLKSILRQQLGEGVEKWYRIITITQFHFMFYMSRPLPNIMALPVVLNALTYWLRRQEKAFIINAGIAILVFRSELLLFLGLLLILDVCYFRNISIHRVLKLVIPTGIVILIVTVTVDSYFWQRVLWPEGEVFWYNAVLNKSSNWGTSPLLWYFYSALPRAMGSSILLVPLGIFWESRIRPITFSALAFVGIYSLLPHKELRFIIYVIPVLNIASAVACQRMWINRAKSLWHSLLVVCVILHLLLNIIISVFLLYISGTNYPGGQALKRLHQLEPIQSNNSVHIANLAAQSGVTRFLQIRDNWSYSKVENLNYTRKELLPFTHLLIEARNKQNRDLWPILEEDFTSLEFVECFRSVGIQYGAIMPIRVKTKPCIGILKRRLDKNTFSTKEKSISN